jgi:sterol desaturase/sphingolipid hydroxylase (fatty acid hydroxylase superfamily)
LQFVVAPYSFFAAFAAWLGVVPFYVIHFASFVALQLATGLVFSAYPILGSYLKVPITPLLIVGCIVVDQLICLTLCVWTPIGRPVRYSVRRTLQSVGYGFINSKTYWLVLLLSLQGFQVDLLALTIHTMIPFHRIMRAARILKPILPPLSLHHTFPAAMFYHYHRMVHLPGAYNEGHRPHHYLQDSTPFDADQHGSGMPEEWFKLMTEISVCLLTGLMPWSFTFPTLKQSFANKVGHTRIEGLHPILDNFHVNHHVKHFKNFGYPALPLDLLMGTEFGDVSRLDNLGTVKVSCSKHIESRQYVLAMTHAGPEIEIEEYLF